MTEKFDTILKIPEIILKKSYILVTNVSKQNSSFVFGIKQYYSMAL